MSALLDCFHCWGQVWTRNRGLVIHCNGVGVPASNPTNHWDLGSQKIGISHPYMWDLLNCYCMVLSKLSNRNVAISSMSIESVAGRGRCQWLKPQGPHRHKQKWRAWSACHRVPVFLFLTQDDCRPIPITNRSTTGDQSDGQLLKRSVTGGKGALTWGAHWGYIEDS